MVKRTSVLKNRKFRYQQRIRSTFYNPFFITSMFNLKLILLVALIICLSHSEGAEWTAWNNFAASNYNTVNGYQQPTAPGNFRRLNSSQVSYSYRPNQYIYQSNYFGAKCHAYCGPRSFLTTYNGLVLCQRDYSSNFWGNYSNLYGQYCIPDMDKTPPCLMNLDYRTLANVGNCNMFSYKGTGYQKYQCCYNDFNSAVLVKTDLTTRQILTSLFDLRNAE